ncbi:protein of unknown function (plasmid) [Azospirillum lipoferum 4B]|uniref:Uncharacterized protein n=1 Tax=Azospirillum lipoferum (strain 4B) TaxID=862719 RepID=G7ZCN8_AZOL4|nr:protein of unknown function [Azospirillum lipoferum 4B]
MPPGSQPVIGRDILVASYIHQLGPSNGTGKCGRASLGPWLYTRPGWQHLSMFRRLPKNTFIEITKIRGEHLNDSVSLPVPFKL